MSETISQAETSVPYAATIRLYELCNKARVDAGLNPLKLDERISSVARTRCQEQLLLLGHTRPNSERFYTAFYDQGWRFSSYGENIVVIRIKVQSYEQKALELWMNSESHRENLLNPKWTLTGLAVIVSEEGYYYAVQLFAC